MIFRFLAFFGLFAALVFSSSALAVSDVTKFDINGFKLRMTVDEARKVEPGLGIMPIMPDGKTVMGYKARAGNVNLYFTAEELGSLLFNIQLLRIFKNKPDAKPLFNNFVERYGTPNFAGRQMMNLNACWGKCFGPHPKMEFKVKITNIGPNKPYPMTLTLSDPVLNRENRTLFDKNRRANK